MTKQSIIQKAYGKYWEIVKGAVDDNGWCLGFYDIRDIDKKSNWMSNNPAYAHLWQPRSLKGIETNNGWYKVSAMTDLPSENGIYIAKLVGGKIQQIKLSNVTKATKENLLLNITHWRYEYEYPEPIY